MVIDGEIEKFSPDKVGLIKGHFVDLKYIFGLLPSMFVSLPLSFCLWPYETYSVEYFVFFRNSPNIIWSS